MLKPLLLPALVEERRKRESFQKETTTDATLEDMEMSGSDYYNANSSVSSLQSPVTPTFSARGHTRYSSSNSSIDVSLLQTPVIDTPSSPIFNSITGGKRALPDVQEEPQEREEREQDDVDMMHDVDDLYDCFCDDRRCGHVDPAAVQSSVQLSTRPDFEYDINNGFFSDGEIEASPRIKKRREGDSPFMAMASKFGTRFPSFSRKWRARKELSTLSYVADQQRERATSLAASSRSSSSSEQARQGAEATKELHTPLTPTRSIFEEVAATAPIDIERANRDLGDREEHLASTPLLPPLMLEAAANSKQPTMQSPLQSPSVAEPNDPFSGSTGAIDAITTPQLPQMPSPPLSSKPSVSSIHRANMSRAPHLIPSSEIPPFHMADENDEWAKKLGHANFTVLPEPYLPAHFDIEACRQLRADWDLARCNYTKHLVRTGEHYGVTSKTYILTEEKWAQTDAQWKENNEITIQGAVDGGADAFSTLKHTTLGGESTNVMTKIPSLNDPQSQGKFPQLGDEDIVGPMVQVAAQLQRSPSKKAKIIRFFAEKFPVGLGRS